MPDGKRRNESGRKNEAGKSMKELEGGIERKQKMGTTVKSVS
jgi:hypothetical protein